MEKYFGLASPRYEIDEFDKVDANRKHRVGNVLLGFERINSIMKHLDWLNGQMPSTIHKMRESKEYSLLHFAKAPERRVRLRKHNNGTSYTAGNEGKPTD